MKVIWALLCQTIVTDRDTNNLSLINVVDEIIVPASPPDEPSRSDIMGRVNLGLEMAVLWIRSNPALPESGEARVTIVTPDNSSAVSEVLEVDLTQTQRIRGVGHWADSPFPSWQEGQYLFKIEARASGHSWQKVFELPLWVRVQTEDPPP